MRIIFINFFLLTGMVSHPLNQRSNKTHFTIDELLTTTFPKKTSKDLDLYPCKAGGFLGDIVVPFEIERVKRAATARKERIWDNGIIPYEIDLNSISEHETLFKQAMRHWENHTCVQFIERNKDEHPDYIFFTERPCGCCSFVGKRGNGGQAVSIGRHCDKFGIVVHELGHAIGFWHEHTRPDRDQHVEILKENIMPGQEYNFNKLSEEDVNSLGTNYDYDSIMHYSKNTFSKFIYLDTIRPVGSEKRFEIGQRLHLSAGDIEETNLLYKCPRCGRTFQSKSATFSSKDAKKFKNTRCEWRIAVTHGERIVLKITDLDLEKSSDCTKDFIEIRDGHWHKSPLLGKFCGSGEIEAIKSSGSRMWISYLSTGAEDRRGFTAHYEAICGGDIFVETQAHLESPNYPSDYQSNTECIWKIQVKEDHQIVMKFQYFELENIENCAYDYLEVRDGSDVGVYCGSNIPADIVSSSNLLFVKFVSDDSVQKSGFSATILREYDECVRINHGCEQLCVNILGGYECRCRIGYELHSDGKHCEVACGGVITSEKGTITSPSFPDLYPTDKTCIWEITAPKQHRIILNFTHFDIEGNDLPLYQHCEYDYLQVTSVENGRNKTNLVFCGSKAPKPIISDANILRIVFNSDNSLQKTGFAIVFTTEMDECEVKNGGCQQKCIKTIGGYKCGCEEGFTIKNEKECQESDCNNQIDSPFGHFGSPGYPGKYLPDKNCIWQFKTAPGHRIQISFLTFDTEPIRDYIQIYDGNSSDSYTIGKFSGFTLPEMIFSSSEQLHLVFQSDSSVQKKGFWGKHSSVCGASLLATTSKKYVFSHARFGFIKYRNGANCEWIVKTSPGYGVKLAFASFDVETEKNCNYDFVEILSETEYFGKFCGINKPMDIVSRQDLLVRFHSDETLAARGFQFSYEAVEYFDKINAK